MTARTPYTYVLLRYRHDPLAGEFANVGLVLHSPKAGFLAARVRRTVGRLSAMFPGLHTDALKSSLKIVERGIRRLSEAEGSDLLSSIGNAATYAARVLPSEDSSFIWSELGSGMSADPQQTLDNLYQRFIGRYDERPRGHRDDAAVWKPVRDLLLQRQIADRLQAITISSDLEEIEFDHAWKNGAWHCYQPLSFDLASGESIREKASRWAGQLLALQQASEPFRTHFVVGPPRAEALMADYEKALAILQLGPVKPEVVEEFDIPNLVDRIEDEIRAHDAAVE